MLTQQEQAELAALEEEEALASRGGLSPEEEMELAQLEQEEMLANQAEPQSRPVEAFTQGFGNAVSLGYLPQIQAASEPIIQKALGLFGDNTDEKLRSQGFIIDQPEQGYIDRRDRYIQEGQRLSEENPVSSFAGNAAGALTSGVATGAGLAGMFGKAASLAGRAGQAAASGVIYGAIRNPGDTEGEINLLQLEDRAKNAAKDAVTGLVTQGGLETAKAIGKGIKGAGKNLKTYSQFKALKGSGAMLKDFRKAVGNKKASELGQAVIDNKLMQYGDDVADIAKRSESAMKESGKKIGKIYDKADEITSLSSDDIKTLNNEFLEESSARLSGKVGGKEVAQKLESALEVLRENPNPTFGQLRKLRASLDDQINYSRSTNDLPEYQSELLALRNKIQDMVKGKIGKVNPELSKQLAKENRNFSNVSEIAKISKDKMAREEANAAFGLRETITGGAGATAGAMIGGGVPGAIVGGALGSISTKIAKKYGTPFVAMTANKVARALEKNQDSIGRFSDQLINASSSPQKFVTTVNALLKDPEFKKQVDSMDSFPVYRGPAKKK
jgi:hypothetical protein